MLTEPTLSEASDAEKVTLAVCHLAEARELLSFIGAGPQAACVRRAQRYVEKYERTKAKRWKGRQ